MTKFKEMKVVHSQGSISIDNIPNTEDLMDADLGIQIGYDGRVWLCINGVSFLRFRPNSNFIGETP